jgi:hypothetical protein
MGRLSRHRKIKTCDPFAPNRGRILAKAERAKNAKKDEAPTEKQDKAIPRSVREMQALQKREQKIKGMQYIHSGFFGGCGCMPSKLLKAKAPPCSPSPPTLPCQPANLETDFALLLLVLFLFLGFFFFFFGLFCLFFVLFQARKLESKKNNAPKPKANTISVQTSTQTIQVGTPHIRCH